MAKALEQIASGVYRIDTVGIPNAISVLLVADGEGWMLVDTGLHSNGALRIQEALTALEDALRNRNTAGATRESIPAGRGDGATDGEDDTRCRAHRHPEGDAGGPDA